MEQSCNVGISTSHGNIIHIDVEAQTFVKVFKQQCIDESQLDAVPLKIYVDLAGLMNGNDEFTKWEVRLARLNDDALLDDGRSIGSQAALGHNDFICYAIAALTFREPHTTCSYIIVMWWTSNPCSCCACSSYWRRCWHRPQVPEETGADREARQDKAKQVDRSNRQAPRQIQTGTDTHR